MFIDFLKNDILLIITVTVVVIYIFYQVIVMLLKNKKLKSFPSVGIQNGKIITQPKETSYKKEGRSEAEIGMINEPEVVLTKNLEKYQKLLG